MSSRILSHTSLVLMTTRPVKSNSEHLLKINKFWSREWRPEEGLFSCYVAFDIPGDIIYALKASATAEVGDLCPSSL